jgi:hypothetical protein
MFTMLGLVWHGAVLQDAGWLLLAGFLPALIMVSVHHKKRRGGQLIAFLQHDLELAGDRYFELFAKYKKRNLDGNSRADFNVASFPIICITAICVFFAAILVFTSYFVTDPNSCSMFLEVMQYANGCGHAYPTLVAVSFAYLGWYAWAVSGVFSRLVTMEFMSGSLYALLSRLVLSIIVAAVLYNIWDDVARAAQVTTGWVKADPAFIGFFHRPVSRADVKLFSEIGATPGNFPRAGDPNEIPGTDRGHFRLADVPAV